MASMNIQDYSFEIISLVAEPVLPFTNWILPPAGSSQGVPVLSVRVFIPFPSGLWGLRMAQSTPIFSWSLTGSLWPFSHSLHAGAWGALPFEHVILRGICWKSSGWDPLPIGKVFALGISGVGTLRNSLLASIHNFHTGAQHVKSLLSSRFEYPFLSCG